MEHSIHASHPHAAGHGAAHVTPRSEREHPIQDAPAEHLHHAHRHKHDPLREHSETPAEFRERHKKDAEAAENTVHHYEGQLPAVATHAQHVLQNPRTPADAKLNALDDAEALPHGGYLRGDC